MLIINREDGPTATVICGNEDPTSCTKKFVILLNTCKPGQVVSFTNISAATPISFDVSVKNVTCGNP